MSVGPHHVLELEKWRSVSCIFEKMSFERENNYFFSNFANPFRNLQHICRTLIIHGVVS